MRVDVISPKIGSSDRAVALPGSVQPLEETVLYARASGYVRRWLVDIGDKVDGRPAPRRDRDAGARPGARSGASAARAGPALAPALEGQPGALEREPAALPAADARRRRLPGRSRPAAGAGAGRRGERQRGAGHHRRPGGEHPPPDAAQGLRPRDGAVRGLGDAAMGRGRRARHGRQRAAALPDRRDRPGARLRPGPAGRGAGPSRRRARDGQRARVPGAQVRRKGLAQRRRARRNDADDEHRDPRAQRRRSAHRGHVRRGRADLAVSPSRSSSCRRRR